MNSFRSEYLKFIYNKWLLLTVLSTIILVPLFVIFLHETPSYITEDYVLTQILESFYLGQAGIIIITILFIGQEFNGSTLRSSLLANPTRWKFFFIKLIVILSISILVWSLVAFCTICVVYTFYGLLIPLLIYTFALRIILIIAPLRTQIRYFFSLPDVNNNWQNTPPDKGIKIIKMLNMRIVSTAGSNVFPKRVITNSGAIRKSPTQLGIDIAIVIFRKL